MTPGGRSRAAVLEILFQRGIAFKVPLMASGAVQLWNGTDAAFVLLADWEASLLRHPKSEDDHCLDLPITTATARPTPCVR